MVKRDIILQNCVKDFSKYLLVPTSATTTFYTLIKKSMDPYIYPIIQSFIYLIRMELLNLFNSKFSLYIYVLWENAFLKVFI